MTDFLSTILAEKKSEAAGLRAQAPSFGPRPSPRRPFAASLRRETGLSVIAEVKKASPSKGLICPDFNPAAIARRYRTGGAAAISVLTDGRFFQGSSGDLTAVRSAVDLPVLRKDFIIDEVQVRQTAHLGADAMLLIAAALSNAQLDELYRAAVDLDIEPLVEVHSGEELDRALAVGPRIIGINNRDLTTFRLDLRVTEELAARIPPGVTVVAESGIFNRDDARRVSTAGAHAVLVGESLMRSADPAALIQELCGAGTH